ANWQWDPNCVSGFPCGHDSSSVIAQRRPKCPVESRASEVRAADLGKERKEVSDSERRRSVGMQTVRRSR
ncbi:hypothetical protein K438DRAFT_1866678, partial [Mycena galopus ATCC 62051]